MKWLKKRHGENKKGLSNDLRGQYPENLSFEKQKRMLIVGEDNSGAVDSLSRVLSKIIIM